MLVGLLVFSLTGESEAQVQRETLLLQRTRWGVTEEHAGHFFQFLPLMLSSVWLLEVSSPFLDQLYWLLLFLETPNTLFTASIQCGSLYLVCSSFPFSEIAEKGIINKGKIITGQK